LEMIQRRLGHASIRTTADIYGSLPEKLDRGGRRPAGPALQGVEGRAEKR
jgi:integrase